MTLHLHIHPRPEVKMQVGFSHSVSRHSFPYRCGSLRGVHFCTVYAGIYSDRENVKSDKD